MLFLFFQSLAQSDHKGLQAEMEEMEKKENKVSRETLGHKVIEGQKEQMDLAAYLLQDNKQDGLHTLTQLSNQQNLEFQKEMTVG